MTRKSPLVLLLTTLGAAGTVAAQVPSGAPPASAAESQCPPSLQVQQTPSGAALASGWEARGSNASHLLTHIAIYAGPPGDLMPLTPQAQQRIAKTMTTQWNLAPFPRGYWVACGYAGTSAIATRPLDKGVTSCVAEHDLSNSPPLLKRWSCRGSDQP